MAFGTLSIRLDRLGPNDNPEPIRLSRRHGQKSLFGHFEKVALPFHVEKLTPDQIAPRLMLPAYLRVDYRNRSNFRPIGCFD